ncbi:putative low-complexity protein [Cylindrospermum stagnale PCC 7417]|uniref:Putative low-complexity protein n=1 Tax=Cylindrospermum stagnale PCC 7417 TaxID=56107 RepID=K9X2Y8_9NOST|nr:pentapeptide repeat-containing protein [Cylindrospermum stagnale]AFZ26828.1 putative low-complexity protein [Cylindrospermum stagnale PCC 7417]
MSRDALVVGINSYSYEGLNTLQAPAQDAEAIAQLLEKYGDFKVTRLPAVKNKENNTIRVGKQAKVAHSDLKKAIVQLFKPEGHPPDTALLYFSGHGLREDIGVEEGYLATSDVNPLSGNWGLSLQWLRRLLQESSVRQQIVVLDCCYSGEVLNFTEADPGDRGKGRDRCFIAASRAFEVAYEEIGNQHSLLTSALLKGLEPKSEQWVTNYTSIELLSQQNNSFPQRPIFANSGEPIQLTRRGTASTSESRVTSGQTTCPYKGLEYFDCTEEDAKYFYGRTALTDQLLEKLRVGNFLAVLGASGNGKSSVVRAGLLYELKQGRRLSGSDSWQIKIFRPGQNPLQNLALTFVDGGLSDVDRASQLARAEELVNRGADGLRQLIDVANTQRVVLVADQFEEAFTLCQDIERRKKFFECLMGVLQRHDNKLCLVLTMRADFFGKCAEQEYSGLARHIQENLVTVTPMSEQELREAIIKPANLADLEVEPELVEQILKDVQNAPGYLPLLQYTLTELWNQRSDNCLRVNTYAKLGGVMGTLEKRATEVYESFSELQQAAVRHIFLSLTQLGEGTEDTRRRVLQQDLINQKYPAEVINEVVQRLADEKLIVTTDIVEKGGTSARVAVVDVAHEALIRHWGLLRSWLDADRKMLLQIREIEGAAEKWRDHHKAKGYLLQGKPLDDAIVFQKKEAVNFGLSNLAGELIKQSRRYRQNNRLRLLGFGFVPLVILAIYLGRVTTRQIQISQQWDTVEKAKGQEKSPARILALQELVKLGVDLNNIPLQGTNLYRVDLSGANLFGANLERANLERAAFKSTNLSGTNLSGTNLSGAVLAGANLAGADLAGANLYFAKLSGADLAGAKNLTPEQVKNADDWQQACYEPEFRNTLGLPPENPKDCGKW